MRQTLLRIAVLRVFRANKRYDFRAVTISVTTKLTETNQFDQVRRSVNPSLL